MPKSIWNETITFGMVNVPIKLYSATESKTVHFREVHGKDGAKVEHRLSAPRRTGRFHTRRSSRAMRSRPTSTLSSRRRRSRPPRESSPQTGTRSAMRIAIASASSA
jgi:hypothetical protein